MTAQDSGLALAAVQAYFEGERREAVGIVVVALAFILVTGLLYVVARDGFARGLWITVSVLGVLLGATAGSLLVRDAGLQSGLTAAMTADAGASANAAARPAETALDGERARIATVISKYPRYRIGALVIAVLALGTLFLLRVSWVHGTAVGLLLLVAAQVVIDHYSERRANVYLRALSAVHARVQPTLRDQAPRASTASTRA